MTYFTDRFDDEVIRLLNQGGVGLLPSDTIYGLSCLALDKTAVEKIFQLKQRDSHKPCIVLISDLKQLGLLGLSKTHATYLKDYWPGRISLEFEAGNAPYWLHRGANHFAVRMPSDNALAHLIQQTGPITSTSANLQGGRVASSVGEAYKYFGSNLDFYVDAGLLSAEPSTLVIVKDGRLRVVRKGAVKINQSEDNNDTR